MNHLKNQNQGKFSAKGVAQRLVDSAPLWRFLFKKLVQCVSARTFIEGEKNEN